jgi:hypothetical protein
LSARPCIIISNAFDPSLCSAEFDLGLRPLP